MKTYRLCARNVRVNSKPENRNKYRKYTTPILRRDEAVERRFEELSNVRNLQTALKSLRFHLFSCCVSSSQPKNKTEPKDWVDGTGRQNYWQRSWPARKYLACNSNLKLSLRKDSNTKKLIFFLPVCWGAKFLAGFYIRTKYQHMLLRS